MDGSILSSWSGLPDLGQPLLDLYCYQLEMQHKKVKQKRILLVPRQEPLICIVKHAATMTTEAPSVGRCSH